MAWYGENHMGRPQEIPRYLLQSIPRFVILYDGISCLSVCPLCIKSVWPGMARTIWGDHKRFLDTYYNPYPSLLYLYDGISCLSVRPLYIKSVWPVMAWTIWGDHKRFLDTYYNPYPGLLPCRIWDLLDVEQRTNFARGTIFCHILPQQLVEANFSHFFIR